MFFGRSRNVANRADLADALESPEHQETMLLGFRYNPNPTLSAGVVIHGAASILENPLTRFTTRITAFLEVSKPAMESP